jgi:hypothetical protein
MHARTRAAVGMVAGCLVLAGCDDHPDAESDLRLHEERLRAERDRIAKGPTPDDPALPVDRSQIGECLETTVRKVISPLYYCVTQPKGCRFEVSYELMQQVSPKTDPVVEGWRTGDRVRLCLVEVSENCPSGSLVGRTYAATNLRTNYTWTAGTPWPTC